ncbi:P-loop containing nucleoside triphosphate hydrolase protein [Favolaschia claudopus]|uniref:P-loop containing nucleoside triphosphate hydrolase protein n=1 Tax=Favolaschia claudopus TaxID=2862362 RepID=A0AAV9ZZY5_9AGAR
MDALKSLVQPFVSGGSMVDGMKLVVIGGTVETARRMSSSAWSHFVNSFFLTAHFSEEDHPYDWLMLWLSRRPEWQRSREFETTTRAAHAGAQAWEEDEVEAELMGFSAAAGAQGEGLEGGGVGEGGAPSSKTRVIFQPTFDSTHTIYWRGHWLRVRRSRGSPPSSSNNSSFWGGNLGGGGGRGGGGARGGSGGGEGEVLSVSVIARSNTILKALVLQAKREYEAEAVHRIQIFFADPHGTWRWADSRHKRPLGSIVLDPGVKEMLLGDARDFLGSEKWYNDRGIPFRRGYLLHGVPGSGKSSLIHAIAGELMLDIYVVSLSSAWISDTVLMSLMGRVPKGAILLLEDLDAAFTRSVSRMDGEGSSGEGSETKRRSRDKFRERDTMSELNTLSLSGLLNALDGVAAAEGRILFATTNHLEKLDSALSRPGRMDVWVEFKNASKWQAEALFRNFFPSSDEGDIPLDDGEGDIDLPGTPTSLRSASTSSLWSTSTLTSSASGSSKSAGGRSGEAKKFAAKETTPALPQFGSSNKAYMPPPVAPEIVAAQHSARPLDGKTLAELAKRFADSVPEGEFSVAALQGYLLKNKSRPEAAAAEAAAWVVAEREMRERLRKEKEARETKEKAEREKKRKEKKEAEAAKLKKEKEEAEKAKAQMAAMGQVPTSTAAVPASTTALATSTVAAVPSSTMPVVPTSTVLAVPTASTPAVPATTPASTATTTPAVAPSSAATTVDGSSNVAPPAPEAAAASNAATPESAAPESSSAGATPTAPADGASPTNVVASNADAASASVTPAAETTPSASADAVPPEAPAATASDSEGSESDYDDDLDEAYRSPRPVRRVSAWAMAPGRHGQSQWANYIPPQTSDWRGSSWL